MSKTVQEIMEVMGKTVEVTMKLERKNGSSYAHIADITPEDINEIRYYFDGALYRSVMRCLEVKLKGDWTAKAKKGLLLDSFKIEATHPEGDSVTIGYGGFYIAEAPEYDAAQNLTSIIAYDELYLSMQPYTASLWQSGITVKNYLIAILNKLGINYDTNSLSLMANADKKITSEKFLDIENDSTEAAYTYRDILDEIAKVSGVTFVFKNSLGGDPFKLYAIKPTESGYVIDESNLRSVTIGAKYGPVKGVVLSREPQEDNVYYPSNLSDSQTAVKISNVELIEDSSNDEYRKQFAKGIYDNVTGTEYYLYELDSFGIGFLNFGDIFTLKVCERTGGMIGDEKEYKTIFMRTDMTVSQGVKEKSKLEAPQATSTDYSAAESASDKLLKKTMIKVDKQEQRITALVKESDERYSEFTQTAEGLEGTIADTKNGLEAKIKATAEKAELTYAKKETVDGQIEGITDQIATIKTELEGIDGKIEGKVTTEVQKDTTISILAGKVESKIGGNYVTKATYDDEKQNWLLKTTYDSYVSQTDQKISAAVSRVQKLEDAKYITESQCSSLISAQADNIALSVESNLKYESRNLLMDSECFESLTPSGYHATYQGDYVSTDATYLPSGKARKLTVKANDDSQIAGVSFSPSDTVGGVDKIKPNTTYTLSFWARLYPDDATQSLSSQASVYTATAPNNAIIDTKRTRGLALTKSWQKVVIVFTTQSTVSSFLLRFALAGCVNGQQYAIGISSLKLEVGNVATPWTARTPSVEEVEQYAKAQISMCVQKDKNNNLVSEINISSNLLTINTNNFTLDKTGNMTCSGAKIINGSIKCGKGDMSMEILDGLIVQRELGQTIGIIYSKPDRNGQLAEAIIGTNSVSIISGMSWEDTGSSEEIAQFDFLPDGTLQNGEGWQSANPHGTDTFSAFKHFRVFTDTNGDLSNILMASVGIHTDKGLGVELYDTRYGQVECAVKIRRNDNAIVSIYGIRGGSTSPALTLGSSDGNLYYNGKKLAFTSEGVTAFPDAVGVTSSASYVYVVADKNTGKIGFLSV